MDGYAFGQLPYWQDEDRTWKVNLRKRRPWPPSRESSVDRNAVADYLTGYLAGNVYEDPNELTILGLSGEARRVRVRHYG